MGQNEDKRRRIVAWTLGAALAIPAQGGAVGTVSTPDITVPYGLGIVATPAQTGSPPGGGTGGGGGGGGGGGSDVSGDDGGSDSGVNARRRTTGGGTALPAIATRTTPANPTATALIIQQVEESEELCASVPRQYRIDCLSNEFGDLARRLPRRGDYSEAQAVLDRVSRELDTIARQSIDRAQPRVAVQARSRSTNTTRRTAPLTAVRAERLPVAEQQASQSIEQARVQLLRSVPSGDPRQVHYQRISAAFDDTAVLLRS